MIFLIRVILFVTLSSPILASEQVLLKLEAKDLDQEFVGRTKVVVATDRSGNLEKVFLQHFPETSVNLEKLYTTSRKKSQVLRVFFIKIATFETRRLSPQSGGQVEMLLPGRFFVDRKGRRIVFGLRRDETTGIWSALINDRPVYAVHARSTLSYDQISVTNMPQAQDIQFEFLNCDNRNEFYEMTGDLGTSLSLRCSEQTDLIEFFQDRMIPDGFGLPLSSSQNSHFSKTQARALKDLRNIRSVFGTQYDEALAFSAAEKGNKALLDYLLSQNQNLAVPALRGLCGQYVQSQYKDGEFVWAENQAAFTLRDFIMQKGENIKEDLGCAGSMIKVVGADFWESSQYLRKVLDVYGDGATQNFSTSEAADGLVGVYLHFYLHHLGDAVNGFPQQVELTLKLLADMVSAGVPLDEVAIQKLWELWQLNETELSRAQADLKNLKTTLYKEQ